MDGEELVDLILHQPVATISSPTPTELELVRIFREHRKFKIENARLIAELRNTKEHIEQALKGY